MVLDALVLPILKLKLIGVIIGISFTEFFLILSFHLYRDLHVLCVVIDGIIVKVCWFLEFRVLRFVIMLIPLLLYCVFLLRLAILDL